MRHSKITISGFLVGPIWWPSGSECFKPFRHDVADKESRWSDKGTLRDHILAITQDGDFQNCAIAQGEIVATRTNGRRTVTRSFPLDQFPSVRDCLHKDPDWIPDYGDD